MTTETKTTFKEAFTRLFWLILGLMGSMVIAKTIHGYESVLQKHIEVAAFIPVVVYLSDAVGTQMESVIIRELSRNKKFKFSKFFSKQLFITFFVGTILSLSTYLFVNTSFASHQLAFSVAFGLFGGIISSLLTGTFVPFLFKHYNQDPAEASGPIATVIQDFLSVYIFMLVVSVIM